MASDQDANVEVEVLAPNASVAESVAGLSMLQEITT
jgi:hypothetical protein